MTIRIGKISFTNILPIYQYFDPTQLDIELIPQVPTQLNRGMATGEIDMGPISSFAYAEQYPNYVIMPDLSISARGAVRSIFLFTRTPQLRDLQGATVALTNTSASSVGLLRILLEKFVGVTPDYVTMPPSLDEMMQQADAALLIGDDALKALWHNPGYHVIDLGEEWLRQTGESMVFSVWAVRKELTETRMPELEEIYLRFMAAKEKGRTHLQPIIQTAMQQLGGEPTFWQQYYAGLSYDFREQEQRGLATYYRYLGELGLVSSDVQIHLLDLPARSGRR